MFNAKKKTLIIALSAFISASAFADDTTPPTGADQGSGRIHFTGTVINAPCSIAAGDEDINVNMGQVANKVLESGNKYSQNVNYTIHLQDCDLTAQTAGTVEYPAMSKVAVSFAGTPDSSAAELLANTGSAKGAGIRLIDANGDLLKVGDTSKDINLVTGNNELVFAARVEANSQPVSTGTIVSQATYALNYK
ncbi:fimbrial protein [Rahnella aquatilis]|uniref:P pilus assembly protein, pilin FimA n=1 Tax=Rahnella aquatilis (strain ATCC 33071 / DSM 4594 / JCM 1683 / NBRC 105701 / NCIMB 13365 / CIP 78.65) TaxID=745277 RepID=H2IS19_RAHAC|nr:fimbrial protein [Rahnella aquatilis]AEX50350.1 P pilus assembly protein, pilin FimA [Rahnella aquatilis CIP 78.65 = ATCC 33071]KFD01424.1 fimbrial protein [Rahnella aquatilis CIP 78.65 = ATCC 33071]